MQKKLKILISAYACSPYRGSEPGMGWNFVLGLSKYHEVHVISEQLKWKPDIEKIFREKPELKTYIKFYFIQKKRNKKLRKIWPPSYYWYYRQWQKEAFKLALDLDKKENFDIIHQLNMVGYREPGYLWKMEKPIVWGPIGGLENSPWRFLPSLGLKGMVFYTGRNIINSWQRNFSKRSRKIAKQKDSRLIAATEGNSKLIKYLWNKDSFIISEVGQETNAFSSPHNLRSSGDKLRIIWSGVHTSRKNLPLLLRALKRVNSPYTIDILGVGEMTPKWRKLSKKLGLEENCNWHGWLEKNRAIDIMQTGNVFCITSISDLTSTVTLEALSYGLPIVCLDHCGFSHVVTEQCGIKIPVNTPRKATNGFAVALDDLYSDVNYHIRLGKGAIQRAADFNWEKKITQINSIYQSLLDNV